MATRQSHSSSEGIVAATPIGGSETREQDLTPPATRRSTEPGAARADRGDSGAGTSGVVDRARQKGEQTAEQAREKTSQVVDQAQEKASHVADQIRATVSPAVGQAQDKAGQVVGSAGETARGAGSSIVETIKQNPVPAALMGLSLGWLYMNRPSAGRPRSRAEVRAPSQGRSTVGKAVGRTQEETAGQLAGQAQYTVGQLADRVQGQASRARAQFRRILDENPLAIGGTTVALGVAVGLALPETRREDQFLGQARDSLVHQARATAQDTQQKVQRVVEEATTAAQKEAQEQQLTGR